VLSAFWTLGALRAVVVMASEYAGQRRQFGGPIGRFGAVRWRLADLAVACAGLEELAAYTLWLVGEDRHSWADVLALRLKAHESAEEILVDAHVVFAAIGLCDEHDLSVIDRHLQPVLRRPGSIAVTTAALAAEIAVHGFDALFSIPASPGTEPMDDRPTAAASD
jgi:acyl-CoA dehydrogenase